jgi:RHS repeat-associated protein
MDISKPVPGVGHDYVKGLNETVNPANGSLNISVSLPAPASRGLTPPFSLIYNSGLVHHTVTENYNTGENVMVMDGQQYEPIDRSINGWSDTVPYATATTWTVDVPPQDNNTSFCGITGSYTFYDSGGQTHQLGISAISPVGYSGGTGVNSDYCGDSISYTGTASWSDNGYTGKVLGGECDGFHTSNAPGCEHAAPAFSATDLNNTVYTFPDEYIAPSYNWTSLTSKIFPTSIEDRNGNILQVSGAQPNGSGQLTPLVIKDTAGRTFVQLNYADANYTPASYDVGEFSYTPGYTTASANYNANGVQVGPTPPDGNICNATFSVNDTGKRVIHTIPLPTPDPTSYTFDYDPTYGLVNEINYPDGGWVKYEWGLPSTPSDFVAILDTQVGATPSYGFCNYEYYSPVVISRTVGFTAGGSAVQTQTFSYSTTWNNTINPAQWTSKTTTITTTDNTTGKSFKTVYTYTPTTLPQPPLYTSSAPPPPQLPVEHSVVTYDWGPSANPIQTVNKMWKDPYAMSWEQLVLPSGISRQTNYQYDVNDRPIEKDEYDFGSSTLYRKTIYGYYSSTYIASGLASPCQVVTYDGSGNRVSETDAYYDGATSTCASAKSATNAVPGLAAGTHDETNYGSGAQVFRGNITTLARWSNNGTSPATTYTYDETGQPISMTDACGNASCSDMATGGHTTTYSYADYPSDATSAGSSNAYVTFITNPAANGIAQSEQFGYDYAAGVLTSDLDVGNNTKTTYQYDSVNRLHEMYGPADPNNGGQQSQTEYDIVDSDSPSITTKVLMGGSTYESTTAYMDGMGHVIKTDKADSNSYGDDFVVSTYSGMGYLGSVTNPYRPGSDPSLPKGTTYYNYDSLGRVVIQKNQDSTIKAWCRDGFTSNGDGSITNTVPTCPGNLSSQSNRTWTDSYDETSRHWQRLSDGLGRLTAVMEPEASTTPTLETDYQYDLLDNLTKVDQWGGAPGSANERLRIFAYDSLSRLTSACNPEAIATAASCANSGTTSNKYTYDANGNVFTRVDGLGVTTTYAYDVLNRLTQKSYTDNTPSVGYLYDIALQGWGWPSGQQPQTNLVGRSSSVSVGSPNAWIVYGYDVMGHMTMKSECLPRTCGSDHYDMPYRYDLAGNMTFYDRGTDLDRNNTYPNQGYYFGGFNISYDTAGNINSVTADSPDSNHPAAILGQAVYTPLGGLFQGNAVTIYPFTRTYDSRGRYTGIDVIDSAGQAIWNTTTGYYGNGSVQKSTDPWNGSWTYLYGNTNRLAQVVGSSITMAYTYDHWGNRTSQLITAGTQTATQWTDQHFNANNQLTTIWTNNADGNVTYDGLHHYNYDAENRLVSVDNPNYTYAYDGENNRIAQLQNGVIQKEYLYDFQGRLMSEIGLNFKMARGNIYVGNELLAEDAPDPYRSSTPTATLLRITDQVGTLRAREDVGANWVGAYGSFPFNDNANITNAPWGIPPENDMLFTGKQEDAESGLDYFGARYYNSLRGRFMSPDRALVPTPVPFATLDNPQSLNLYSYVVNDPLSRRDNDGHGLECAPDTTTTDSRTGTLTVTAGACHNVPDGVGSFLTSLNPWGRFGGPAHRATVNKLSEMLQKDGFEVTKEVKIPTPRGLKGSRYVDVVGVKKNSGETKMYQVGERNQNGSPVAREVRAMDDIEQETGIRPQFEDKGLASRLEDIESGTTPLMPEGESVGGNEIVDEPEVQIEAPPL